MAVSSISGAGHGHVCVLHINFLNLICYSGTGNPSFSSRAHTITGMPLLNGEWDALRTRSDSSTVEVCTCSRFGAEPSTFLTLE